MPMEVKMILKAANIKKKDLKNADMAMKTFEIIQKAFSDHTKNLMCLVKKRKTSILSKVGEDEKSFAGVMNIIGDGQEEDKNESREPSKLLKPPSPINLKPAPRSPINGDKTISLDPNDNTGPPPPPPPSANKNGLPPPPPPPPPLINKNLDLAGPKKKNSSDLSNSFVKPLGRRSIADFNINPSLPPYFNL
jgi:hypothetical protein